MSFYLAEARAHPGQNAADSQSCVLGFLRHSTGYPFRIWVGGSARSDGEICKGLDHLVGKKKGAKSIGFGQPCQQAKDNQSF